MEGKLCYTISEVADMFQVNQSLIRFWEKEFPAFIKPKRNKRGVRFYSPKDIENIRDIYHLVKEEKFTLDGAKTALKSRTTSKKSTSQISQSPQPQSTQAQVKAAETEKFKIIIPQENYLKDNHREIYNKLLNIRKIAQKLLDE